MDKRPDQAKEALAHVREASRSALNELRATVGLLRQSGDPEAPTEPAPGLARLDELVGTFRNAGLRVEVARADHGTALPAAVDLAAYRVIQEALTNVQKHAGPEAKAEVSVVRVGPNIEITVLDDGAGEDDDPDDRRRPRTARHARAGHRPARHPHHRSPLRRRLPRPCDPAGQDPHSRHGTSRGNPYDDPCPARRRPGAAAQRVPGARRLGARHGGRRRGVRRRGGGAADQGGAGRRRPDGHPDARHRRPRGHPHDQRRPVARRMSAWSS